MGGPSRYTAPVRWPYPMLLLLVVLLNAPAWSDESPEPSAAPQQALPAIPMAPEEAAPPPTAEDLLAQATESYKLGEHDQALALLQELVHRFEVSIPPGANVPFPVYAQAQIYLGEVQVLARDLVGAEETFRTVLERDPSVPISPYDHPQDVISFFEFVRDAVNAELQAQPSIRHPLPWWGYAPLGIPQFKQNRPVRGAIAAVLQLGFAGASIGAWVAIDDAQIPRGARPGNEVAQERMAARATLLRNGLSIPAASAFYLTWGASALDGGLSWRKEHPPAPAPMIGIAPRFDAPGLVIVGSF